MNAPLLFRAERCVSVEIDGRRLEVPAGMMLASALAHVDVRHLRNSPRAGTPRGAFCLMGACQECAIQVDGKLRQACMTVVRDGMVVSLKGAP